MPLFVTHPIKIIFIYIHEELGSNGFFFKAGIYIDQVYGGAVLQVLPASSPDLEVDLNCMTHTQMRETEVCNPSIPLS